MASKVKSNGLNGMHTAGIYSDMTVDGPEIGTLVVIVDRAKNLPNRKSIGKQDPYCAARLGKEAKKTTTDRRGGQTPRWDQELRFVVHDSPDYYQMKVSVFNDDKKTDLIGETWVSLQEVVVPGGGQNDLWHNLNCKGKYAGEIRIEITYYDTRPPPKQEKATDRVRQGTPSGTESPRDSLGGPRQQKVVKRRPLPADPTGATPSPAETSDYVATPPRPDYVQTPPRPDYIQTPPRPDYAQTPSRDQTPLRSFQTQPAYIQTQSPLQSVEYNAAASMPNTSHTPLQYYNTAANPEYASPSGRAPIPTARNTQQPSYRDQDPEFRDVFNSESIHGRNDTTPNYYNNNDQSQYGTQEIPYEVSPVDQYEPPLSPGGPPPPPPAHRSTHASPAVAPLPSHHSSYGFPPPQASRFDTTNRHSMPAYNHANSYQAYSPPKDYENQGGRPVPYQEAQPRHHSYDDRYNGQYDSMQPSVEDAPPSPSPAYHSTHRNSSAHSPLHDDRRYEQVPSPAPLNLSGRNSAVSDMSQSYGGYGSSVSQNSYRGQSQMESDLSSRTSYSQQSHNSGSYRRDDDRSPVSPIGYIPPVPASLVAGMDPLISQEISDRIYSEGRDSRGGRKSYSQNDSYPGRGRYQEQPQQHQNYAQQHETSQSFVPAGAPYDDHQGRVSTGPYAPIIKPRAISPDPRAIGRKSVSPAPPSRDEPRPLSAVPFGPDAYDAFNPSVTPVKPTTESKYNTPSQIVDPDAKIIMHDGREIDPSDHLPESTWAAEPEKKTPKTNPNSYTRPSPSGAQPMPPSGRRPLRMAAGRPQSTSTLPGGSPSYMSTSNPNPSTPPAAGRNRLQKKSNRPEVHHTPQSSPLAPITPYQDNSSYNTRSLPRAHTIDFSAENRSPASYPFNQGWKNGVGPSGLGQGSPPVPAKIPLGRDGGPGGYGGGGGGYGGRESAVPPAESAWALLEEMKSIDLGSGRARRKG